MIYSKDVDEFWRDIWVAHGHSLFRDFAGILNKGDGTLVPPDHPIVEPGSYILVGRTNSMSDRQLYQVLDDARNALKSERPLTEEKVKKVHNELLLSFNHFSLQHEGSSLGVDEIEMITNLLASKDSKREIEDEELGKINEKVPGSKHDIVEAVNHILVSQHLQEMAKSDITEATLLQLHSSVMDGLLTNVEEGMAGEYRKVSINVMGDTWKRPHLADIPPLMATLCKKELVQTEEEHIIEFLSRIHSSFQDIHPFRDGNGRVGRLLMNMILLKQSYPVLTFPPTLSSMFNQGVSNGIRGNQSIFKRLLAESLFSSFHAYEAAIGVRLLPSIKDTVRFSKKAEVTEVTS